MKLHCTPDGLGKGQRAGYLLLEIGLLLLIGCLAAVGAEWRYHPLFASNPLNSHPFWQRALFFGALFSIIDVAWILLPRRWENPWPIGISLVFLLIDAVEAQFAYVQRRWAGRT